MTAMEAADRLLSGADEKLIEAAAGRGDELDGVTAALLTAHAHIRMARMALAKVTPQRPRLEVVR